MFPPYPPQAWFSGLAKTWHLLVPPTVTSPVVFLHPPPKAWLKFPKARHPAVSPSTCSDVSSGVSPPTLGLVPEGAASNSASHSGTRSDMHSPAPNSGAHENPQRPNNTPSPQRQPPQTVSRLFSTPPATTSTAAKGKHKQSVIILSDVEGDDSPLTDIGEGENLNTGKEHKKRKLLGLGSNIEVAAWLALCNLLDCLINADVLSKFFLQFTFQCMVMFGHRLILSAPTCLVSASLFSTFANKSLWPTLCIISVGSHHAYKSRIASLADSHIIISPPEVLLDL
jgi:hypothetical protein